MDGIVLGVKFCGGCNPLYDRRSFLDNIISDNPNITVTYFGADPPGCDLALVLCGCKSECFDYTGCVGRYGRICAFSRDDFQSVAQRINEIQLRKAEDQI